VTIPTLFTGVLPPGVVAVDAVGDTGGGVLFPEEEQAVAHAADKRVRQFTGVRECARSALGVLGLSPRPLLSGHRGEPLWPDGIVGSLTHCDGYCAAAVARRTTVRAVGIDAEPHLALPRGVEGQVTLSWERERVRSLPNQICWDRLLFSAKESVYKAWFPLTGSWLGFQDALVEPRPDGPDPTSGELVVRLLVSPALRPGCWPPVLTGRYAILCGFLLTAVTLT
jgi:4'-phosphopantetheinyl transferase EntD